MTDFDCLILDYDNTVASTVPDIQYDAFLLACREIGIPMEATVEEYLLIDDDPGLRGYVRKNHPELIEKFEVAFRKHVDSSVPPIYGGMKDIIEDFKETGGIVCVVSNSDVGTISCGFRSNGISEPDKIYGKDSGEKYRKPSTKSVDEILACYGLSPSQLYIVDDRMPGLQMAKAAGISCGVAGWGITLKSAKERIIRNAPWADMLDSVSDLRRRISLR